jgi:hypothetical protein
LDQLNISRISGRISGIRQGNLVSGRIPDTKKAGLSGRISGASLFKFYTFPVCVHSTEDPIPVGLILDRLASVLLKCEDLFASFSFRKISSEDVFPFLLIPVVPIKL